MRVANISIGLRRLPNRSRESSRKAKLSSGPRLRSVELCCNFSNGGTDSISYPLGRAAQRLEAIVEATLRANCPRQQLRREDIESCPGITLLRGLAYTIMRVSRRRLAAEKSASEPKTQASRNQVKSVLLRCGQFYSF